MGPTNVQRDLKKYEQHRSWIIIGLAAGLPLCCLSMLIPVFGFNLRGYTAFGVLMGIVAVVLSILTFFYSLRKRTWQEKMPKWLAKRRGTMMMWLWGHVYLGVLALIAAVAHAGYGLFSFNLSSGKLLFAVFAVLVLSGVAWRLIYRVVPSQAQPKIGNYSQAN